MRTHNFNKIDGSGLNFTNMKHISSCSRLSLKPYFPIAKNSCQWQMIMFSIINDFHNKSLPHVNWENIFCYLCLYKNVSSLVLCSKIDSVLVIVSFLLSIQIRFTKAGLFFTDPQQYCFFFLSWQKLSSQFRSLKFIVNIEYGNLHECIVHFRILYEYLR